MANKDTQRTSAESYRDDRKARLAWRSTAVFVADHFNKGDMIAVRGALQSRQYTDKNGNNRTAIEVVAEEISFC